MSSAETAVGDPGAVGRAISCSAAFTINDIWHLVTQGGPGCPYQLQMAAFSVLPGGEFLRH